MIRQKFSYVVIFVVAFLIFAAVPDTRADKTLDSIAETYVKLVLKVGQYDEYLVDSYFGPEEWKPAELSDDSLASPYEEFLIEADSLAARLHEINPKNLSGFHRKRYFYLEKQIIALTGRIEMLSGKTMSFDVETRTLFDLELPPFNQAYYDSLLQELDKLLLGDGTVAERFNAFRAQLKVPDEKVEEIFNAGMSAARERVSRYVDVPKKDSVSIEFVTDRWWSADCRYKGNGHSHMQLNIDNSFYLDEAITLPCHELYPGHHLSFLFIDRYLLEDSSWVEFSIIPIFSPLPAMMEGTAEYGIELTFPKEDWIEFAESVLCPIAGIDTGLIEPYYEIWKLKNKLNPVESHIARQYLDGEIDSEAAKARLMYYAIYSEDEVDDRIEGFDSYRSYVVNYYVGNDRVRDYIEASAGGTSDLKALWAAFAELLKTPATPSTLKETQ